MATLLRPSGRRRLFLFSLLFLARCSPGTPQCHRARGAACDVPMAPATHFLGLAMDVTTLEPTGGRVLQLEEDRGPRARPPRGGPVATCVVCPDLLAGGRPRRLPPGVREWRSGRRCRQRSRVATGSQAMGTVVATTQEVARRWQVGLALGPGKVGAVVAGSHSRVAHFGLQRQQEDRYDFASLEMSCVFYWAQVSPSARLSPHFLRAVRALPPAFTPATAADYEELLAAYGTHYIRGARLGGRLRAVTAIRSCRAAMAGLSAQEVADCLGVEVTAGGGAGRASAMAAACRRARGGNQGNVSFNEAFGERLVEVEGGEQDGDLLYGRPEAYARWLRGLPALPGLVGAEVRPLHTLLPHGDPRRGSLKAAVGHYVARRALSFNCSRACPGGHLAGPCRCGCPAHVGSGGVVTPDCCPRRRGVARLRVLVWGGQGWRGDHFSKTDAYVRVVFGGREARTATAWNQERPRWGSWLELGTVELPPPGASPPALRLEVWDEDNKWDDDLLGVCGAAPAAGGQRREVCYPGGGRLEWGYEVTCGPSLGGPSCHDYVPQSPPGQGGFYHGSSDPHRWGAVGWPQEEEEEEEEGEGEEDGGHQGVEGPGVGAPWGEEDLGDPPGEATDAFGDLPEPLGVFGGGGLEAEPESGPIEGPSDPQDPPSGPMEGSSDPQDPPSGPIEGPSDPQDPSSSPMERSSDPEDPPSSPIEEPSDPQDPPSGPIEGPSDPQDPPSSPIEGPSDPQDPPSSPTEGPSALQDPSLGPRVLRGRPRPPAPRRFLQPHGGSSNPPQDPSGVPKEGPSDLGDPPVGSPGGSSEAGPSLRLRGRSPRPIGGPPDP